MLGQISLLPSLKILFQLPTQFTDRTLAHPVHLQGLLRRRFDIPRREPFDIQLRDQRAQLVAPAHQRLQPKTLKPLNRVAHLRHLQRDRPFSALDPFVLITVAIAPEDLIAAAFLMAPTQTLTHFQLHSLLQHQLRSEANRLGERSSLGGPTEKFLF